MDNGLVFGDKVKRKSLAESCQNARLEVNILLNPSTPSTLVPHAESSE